MNIPTDWSKISDEEALKYIAYLNKHSYKYRISTNMNDVTVKGCTNIVAHLNLAYKSGLFWVTINKKEIYPQSPLYKDARDLYEKLYYKGQPFKTKAKEFLEDNGYQIKQLAILIIFITGVSFFIKASEDHRKHEQEQFKQEIINEALERFKQEQQKNNSTIQYPIQKSK